MGLEKLPQLLRPTRVISADENGQCHLSATHFLPNTAAKPNSLEASEYNLTSYEDIFLKSKNIPLPLNVCKNSCHACKSARAS